MCSPIRALVLGTMLLAAAPAHAEPVATPSAVVRFGLTPVFLDDQLETLRAWKAYLGSALGQEVQLRQRASYQEITELLLGHQLDFAWICGFPYVRHQRQLHLVGVPVFEGKPLYRSYLIVPVADRDSRSLADLRGRVFAYSDPDSKTRVTGGFMGARM